MKLHRVRPGWPCSVPASLQRSARMAVQRPGQLEALGQDGRAFERQVSSDASRAIYHGRPSWPCILPDSMQRSARMAEYPSGQVPSDAFRAIFGFKAGQNVLPWPSNEFWDIFSFSTSELERQVSSDAFRAIFGFKAGQNLLPWASNEFWDNFCFPTSDP
jgi:hypothetical protein